MPCTYRTDPSFNWTISHSHAWNRQIHRRQAKMFQHLYSIFFIPLSLSCSIHSNVVRPLALSRYIRACIGAGKHARSLGRQPDHSDPPIPTHDESWISNVERRSKCRIAAN